MEKYGKTMEKCWDKHLDILGKSSCDSGKTGRM